MRLITRREDTTSFELQEFFDQTIPPYAILSHTWGKDEATYQDFVSGHGPSKEGYIKIEKTYDLASQAGIEYLWVDTCCIDKTSSAELTEAINAMFAWYARAQVCYAYLNDFDSEDLDARPLANALWWSRGWTLQELIAPVDVQFYDKAWRCFGTRAELNKKLEIITGIPADVLKKAQLGDRLRAIQDELNKLTVAQRMSWAAKRQTTREEDIAYSILGIFGVNMPMVYGQGSRAFQRLQEEIIKESNDLTILAWKAKSAATRGREGYAGILATHPSEFENSGSYELPSPIKFNPTFVMTNKGLQIDANVQKVEGVGADGTQEIIMSLECCSSARADHMAWIALKHLGGGVYVRCHADSIVLVAKTSSKMSKGIIFLSRTVNEATASEVATLHRSAIQFDLRTSINTTLVDTQPQEFWEPERQLFIPPQSLPAAGYHLFRWKGESQNSTDLEFVLAFSTSGTGLEPWRVWMGESSKDKMLYKAAVAKDLAAVASLVGEKLKRKAKDQKQGSSTPIHKHRITLRKEEVTLGKERITKLSLKELRSWEL